MGIIGLRMFAWPTDSFLRTNFFSQKEELFVKAHPQIEKRVKTHKLKL